MDRTIRFGSHSGALLFLFRSGGRCRGERDQTLLSGDGDISALAAELAAEMFAADSADSTTGGALHRSDKGAGVVHTICLFAVRFVVQAAAVMPACSKLLVSAQRGSSREK